MKKINWDYYLYQLTFYIGLAIIVTLLFWISGTPPETIRQYWKYGIVIFISLFVLFEVRKIIKRNNKSELEPKREEKKSAKSRSKKVASAKKKDI